MTTIPNASRPLPVHPDHVPETIDRPFFLTGIAVILTAGAGWGAWLLWRIGGVGSFTDISIHAVNAHGHAQIFGWVGLFIMGFAYQALPRMWKTRLVAPHLALLTFALMLMALIVRTVAMGAAETWPLAPTAVLVAGLIQVLATVIFAAQIALTFRRSGEAVTPAVAFMFAALFWFVAMTAFGLWHTLALIHAPDRDTLLTQIATYQGALRDMQIHGLALCMILGVSMRFFPGMFGLSPVPARRGWVGYALIAVAVVLEIILLIASQVTGNMRLAGLLMAPWTMLAVGVAMIALPWRLWKPLPKTDRSAKFVRIAYLWLGISLAMLLALPLYTALNEMAFSHAYYGAIRHAVTVGFISMMIMAMAAKVVPVLNGADPRTLSALWGPFLLVNVGCALRVSMQVTTDWHDGAYAIIGFSGAMELTGLAWWGLGLTAIIWKGWRGTLPVAAPAAATPTAATDQPDPHAATAVITPDLTAGELAEQHPQLHGRMAALGLDTCCSAERTLRDLAAERGMEPDNLIAELTRNAPDEFASHNDPPDARRCACSHG